MNINIKSLLLGTSLSLIPNLTHAQCVATTDCAMLGYTETSCPNGGIKCPFGDGWYCRQNSSSQEQEEPKATLGTCTGYAQNCSIGQILNSDGTCTSDVNSDKSPLGVIVAIKDNCGWAMTASTIATSIQWSSSYTVTGTSATTEWQTAITDFDACANTQKIIQKGDSSKYPAAWAAVNYSPTAAPATKGKWCLPAPGMLNSLFKNLNVINNTISTLGGTQLTDDNEQIWSSSENFSNGAWFFCTTSGACWDGIGYGSKDLRDYYFTVRPVLAF